MASPHELEGGALLSPYAGEVMARNQSIGDYFHDRQAREFVKRVEELENGYPGLIAVNRERLAYYADLEGQTAGEKALQEREAGMRNDIKSEASGIFVTGLLDLFAVDDLREQLDRHQVTYDLRLPGDNGIQYHYAIHLPDGAFEHLNPHSDLGNDFNLSLFATAEVTKGDFEEVVIRGLATASLLKGGYGREHSHYQGTVGRIEGAGGTLWQNPRTKPDGSFR